jgi:hypothetical protein
MERTRTFVRTWFWPRHATNVPEDVLTGSGSINTSVWGTPTAYFPDDQCDIESEFTSSNIIINLTFCEFALSGAVGLTLKNALFCRCII